MANMETKTETLRRRRDFSAAVISTAASRVAVRVIRTDEDLMIAKQFAAFSALGWPVIITQRKELHDESRWDEWLDGRRDVALDSDWRTGGGPARRLN
jgi:hypothetical protein